MESPRKGHEWNALSIQDRIRAMNDTLDSVEEQEATPINIALFDSSEESASPSNRRQSVIAIWENQRSTTTSPENPDKPSSATSPTAPQNNYSDKADVPAIAADEEPEQTESPPKGARAVRDMWNQRDSAVKQNVKHYKLPSPKLPRPVKKAKTAAVANTAVVASNNEPADLTIVASTDTAETPTKRAHSPWAQRGLQNVIAQEVEREAPPSPVVAHPTTPVLKGRRSVVDIWKNRASDSPRASEEPEESTAPPAELTPSHHRQPSFGTSKPTPPRMNVIPTRKQDTTPSVGVATVKPFLPRLNATATRKQDTTASVETSTAMPVAPCLDVAATKVDTTPKSSRPVVPLPRADVPLAPLSPPTKDENQELANVERSSPGRVGGIAAAWNDRIAAAAKGTPPPSPGKPLPARKWPGTPVTSEKTAAAVPQSPGNLSITNQSPRLPKPVFRARQSLSAPSTPADRTKAKASPKIPETATPSKPVVAVKNNDAEALPIQSSLEDEVDEEMPETKSFESKSKTSTLAPSQSMDSASTATGTSSIRQWMKHAANRPLGPMVGAVVPTPQRVESKKNDDFSRFKQLPLPVKNEAQDDGLASDKSSAFNTWGEEEEKKLSPFQQLKKSSLQMSPHQNRRLAAGAGKDVKPLKRDFVRMGQRHVHKKTTPVKAVKPTKESKRLSVEDVLPSDFAPPSPAKKLKKQLTVDTGSSNTKKERTTSKNVVVMKKEVQAKYSGKATESSDNSSTPSEYTPFDVGDTGRTFSASPADENANEVDNSSAIMESTSRAGSTISNTSLASRAERLLKERRQRGSFEKTSPRAQQQATELARNLMTDSPRRPRLRLDADEKKEESDIPYAHSYIAKEVVRNTPRGRDRNKQQELPQQVLSSDERYLDSVMRHADHEGYMDSLNNSSSGLVDGSDENPPRLPRVRSDGPSLDESYSTGSSEYQSLTSRTTKSDSRSGITAQSRRARIERLRRSHGTFISDEFVTENAQNIEAAQSACGALSVADVASDIVDEVRSALVALGLPSLGGKFLKKAKTPRSKPASAKKTKAKKGAPFDEDVAIEVEYMDDSVDEDDPKGDLGLCAPIDATMAMQWSEEDAALKGGGGCTPSCGPTMSPAGQPSYEEPQQ